MVQKENIIMLLVRLKRLQNVMGGREDFNLRPNPFADGSVRHIYCERDNVRLRQFFQLLEDPLPLLAPRRGRLAERWEVDLAVDVWRGTQPPSAASAASKPHGGQARPAGAGTRAALLPIPKTKDEFGTALAIYFSFNSLHLLTPRRCGGTYELLGGPPASAAAAAVEEALPELFSLLEDAVDRASSSLGSGDSDLSLCCWLPPPLNGKKVRRLEKRVPGRSMRKNRLTCSTRSRPF